MSVEHTNYVWKHSPVKGNARLVLLALADKIGNDEGLCWRSVPNIAEATLISERTVQRMLRELVAAGELEVIREGGGRRPTVYRMAMQHTPDRSSPHVVEPVTSGGDTVVTQYQGTETKSSSSRKNNAPEPSGFEEWLAYHVEKCEAVGISRSVPRSGTGTRADLARMYAKLADQGYNLEDFELATDGVLASEWHRDNGHTKFATVLRERTFAEKVDDGRQARSTAGMIRDPLTGMMFEAGTYA